MKQNKKRVSVHLYLLAIFLFVFPGILVISTNCSLENFPAKGDKVTEVTTQPGTTRDSESGIGEVAYGDFDGDDLMDTAEGNYLGMVGELFAAGYVEVSYGSHWRRDQTWTQDSRGIAGTCEENDWFGFVISAGDYNNDGYDDLAIGCMGEDIGDIVDAGAVNIIYGSRYGLRALGNKLINQDTSGIQGGCEENDRFGFELLSADFNNDGYEDLAVGAPQESIGSIQNAGCVHVILGSSAGLTANGDQFWHLNTGIPGDCVENDYFGEYLYSGDFNGDGRADLVVADEMKTVNSVDRAGGVYVVYGGTTGLTGTGSMEWTAETPGIDSECTSNGRFGRYLSIGKFRGDVDCLAFGDPYADVNGVRSSGEVYVLYGTKDIGLQVSDIDKFNRDTPGIPGDVTQYEYFGYRVNAQYINSDEYEELDIYGNNVLIVICTLEGSEEGLKP